MNERELSRDPLENVGIAKILLPYVQGQFSSCTTTILAGPQPVHYTLNR